MHCKLKDLQSTLKCQRLIQPLLEPFEHNLSHDSTINRLFQATLGLILARGSKSAHALINTNPERWILIQLNNIHTNV